VGRQGSEEVRRQLQNQRSLTVVAKENVMSAVLSSGLGAEAGAVPALIKSDVPPPIASAPADASQPAAAVPPAPAVAAAPVVSPAVRLAQRRALALRFIAPIAGFAMFVLLWQIIAQSGGQIPTPAKVWEAAIKIFSDPFYRKGPNDQGIGWNILASLQRVGIGFGVAALVGIPLGFMVGRFRFLDDMTSPIISLLRPVSPLAWLPIGLLVFKAANPAAIWTIFICSIWPMIINTAVGVRQIPQDYMNVAKVLNLSEWKVFTKILFPAVLPFVLTGVRLSIGVAWLVIVAAEMLTGGVGIGFWVWDEWNNLNVAHIIIAIFTIGIVGLLLEMGMVAIARRFEYS
jgi:nitrate/nitrite transport system permease protein